MATVRRWCALPSKCFALALLVLAWAGISSATAQPALDFGRYFALVIGNDGYRHLPRLKTAGNDARALADLLRARYGFQVELLLDADRDQLVGAINSYRATLRDGDNLLIYYAGHGLIDEPTERGFWLPVDAAKGNEARWIDIALISSNLRAMQARHILVIADSCYSGSLVRAPGAGLDEAVVLQRIRERRARMALTSGSLEPVADGGGSGHSVFANALLRALRESSNILTGADLFARIRARVVSGARQTPLYADIRFAGHEGGDFIFVPRGAEIAVAPAAPAETEAAIELAFWNSIKDSVVADDYRAYLDAFPSGRFAPLARRRAEIQAAAKVDSKPAERPRPSATAPQVAMAPTAPPAIADEAALAERWRDIAIILRRQYDASWAAADGAHFFNTVRSYKLISITPDEITLHLDYMAQDNMRGMSANGYPQLRQAEVRFRNRAPDFRILQWGNLPPLGPGDDDAGQSRVVFRDAEEARQFSPILRRALERQYAATVRFWPAEAISTADSGPPDGMHVKRHEVTALQSGQLTIAVTYDVSTGGTAQRDRQAIATLRNEGPTFEILDWQRQ